jgi:hypothetical protein
MSHVDDVHLLPWADLYEILDKLCQDVVKPFPTLREDKLQNSCGNKGDVQLVGLGPGNQQIDHILGDIEERDQRKDVEKRGPRVVVDLEWRWREPLTRVDEQVQAQELPVPRPNMAGGGLTGPTGIINCFFRATIISLFESRVVGVLPRQKSESLQIRGIFS